MSEETTQTETQAEESTSKPRSFIGRIVKLVVIVAIIAVAGYYVSSVFGGTVATVNGERITKGEYEAYYAKATAILAAQGVDVTTEETKALLKKQSIDDLVVETLVLQKADEEGIVSDAGVVDTQIEESKKQFADEAAFQAELTKQGFTEKTFKETLLRQNIIQQYLAKHVDVSGATPTEAEIQAVYKQAAAANKDLPALSEVRTLVEGEVVRQKQQTLVAAYLNTLKEASEIEILLK